MSIDQKDIKILWGRAAGMCSEPSCNNDLTALVENGSYSIGEMAHIIGSKPKAARGTLKGGSDTYENLILLCPTHHRHIDKAPEGTFPEELLHEWKDSHEAKCRNYGRNQKYDSFKDLSQSITRLLIMNRSIFDSFGPKSDTALRDPESNLHAIWELKRISTIVPNNTKILNIIDANESLIKPEYWPLIEKFRVHSMSYQKHCEHRLDSYPLFPPAFSKIFIYE
jgi:hypothetical protein